MGRQVTDSPLLRTVSDGSAANAEAGGTSTQKYTTVVTPTLGTAHTSKKVCVFSPFFQHFKFRLKFMHTTRRHDSDETKRKEPHYTVSVPTLDKLHAALRRPRAPATGPPQRRNQGHSMRRHPLRTMNRLKSQKRWRKSAKMAPKGGRGQPRGVRPADGGAAGTDVQFLNGRESRGRCRLRGFGNFLLFAEKERQSHIKR